MRRTASEIINELEFRIARLENRTAGRREEIISLMIKGLQSTGPENLMQVEKIGADYYGFMSAEAGSPAGKAIEEFKANVKGEMDKLERSLKRLV